MYHHDRLCQYLTINLFCDAGAVQLPTLVQLSEVVCDIPSDKMKRLAIQLGLDWNEAGEIQLVHDDPFYQFMDMLTKWRRKKYLTGQYTWKYFIAALKSGVVNEKNLADKLQKEYCTPS